MRRRKMLDIDAYTARRLAAVAAVDGRSRGTRTRIAFDSRIAPTLISSLLKGTIVSERMLSAVESWLTEHPIDAMAKSA